MGPKLTISKIQQRMIKRIKMYYTIYEDNKDPDATSIPSISANST
jgi:hypothetical protein